MVFSCYFLYILLSPDSCSLSTHQNTLCIGLFLKWTPISLSASLHTHILSITVVEWEVIIIGVIVGYEPVLYIVLMNCSVILCFIGIKRSILYYWLNFFLLLRNRAIRVFIQTHIWALQSSSLFQQFSFVFPVGKPNYYDWFILLVSPWEPVVGLNVNSVQLNPLCVEERRYLLLHI